MNIVNEYEEAGSAGAEDSSWRSCKTLMRQTQTFKASTNLCVIMRDAADMGTGQRSH